MKISSSELLRVEKRQLFSIFLFLDFSTASSEENFFVSCLTRSLFADICGYKKRQWSANTALGGHGQTRANRVLGTQIARFLDLCCSNFECWDPNFWWAGNSASVWKEKYSLDKYLVNKATVGATDDFLSLIYCYVENRFTLLNNDKRIRGFWILVCLTSIL